MLQLQVQPFIGAAHFVNVDCESFVPLSIINPVYNGTKAWLHSWSMNLRTQLANARSSVAVVEIAPPMVSRDLHLEREDPGDNKKEKNPNGMTVDAFMKEVSEKMGLGDDMITAGMGIKWSKSGMEHLTISIHRAEESSSSCLGPAFRELLNTLRHATSGH
ncbi:hypothetical protein HIM_07875 [Hirsutella minnesotensis 3608]|uniref:Uncharacterized protein n=1 Tax=Hirsutella minnesotensis 3608 TaxID=1043627 RepID=A0A0F7ZT87_9HYPO|nr:hypothetical protein HIM_07875 [Hirsutella minnesotensis 3608]